MAAITAFRSCLRPLLIDCAETYNGALTLKGSSRSEHFLSLSSIAATCGLASVSRDWLEQGIRVTLAYGYRKDATLEVLTDVLSVLGKYRPEKTLPNSAHILELIKWMPEATDGKGTKHFAQHLFPLIVENNRAAALELLRVFFRVFARWQTSECVELYVCSRTEGDPEALWALCALLSPNESFPSREHVSKLASSAAPESAEAWNRRLDAYTKAMINPRHWPEAMWDEDIRTHPRPASRRRNENSGNPANSSYTLDGHQISQAVAVELCRRSFASFVETLAKLKSENSFVSEYELFGVLDHHIGASEQEETLAEIETFLASLGKTYGKEYQKSVGLKYLLLGNISSGVECLEKALREDLDGETFAAIAAYDRQRAENILVKAVAEKLVGPSYHGFDIPRIIARSLGKIGKIDEVEAVFNDFLEHCQELFAQLSSKTEFEELKAWGDKVRDERAQIVDLLLDRMDTHDLEYGNRITDALSELGSSKNSRIVPMLLDRLQVSGELAVWRFLQIIPRLAETTPSEIRQHAAELAALLQKPNVLVKLTVSKAIRSAFRNGEELPADIEQSLGSLDRQYSSTIAYRTFVMLSISPSEEFVGLLEHPTRFSFKTQLRAVSNVLALDATALRAQIERMLVSSGADFEAIKEDSRALSPAFVHVQGWPVIWFITNFDVTIRNLLYQFVDEVLKQISNRDIKISNEPNY